jgi:TPR repeat protein
MSLKSGKSRSGWLHSFILQHVINMVKMSLKMKTSFAWYKAAADQGLSAAQLNVGRMLQMALALKDESLARKYLKKQPATAITVQALTLMMEEQKKNYVGAYQWYELSTRDGMLDNKVISFLKARKQLWLQT